MATLEDFADLIWERIGSEGRELVRESWKGLHGLDPELQPKVLACFLWATWLRGRRGIPDGRPDFWEGV